MKSSIYRCQKTLSLVACAIFSLALQNDATAQQIAVSTPFNSVNDSYFENTGVNFGFSFPGGRGPGSRIVGFGPGGNIGFGQGNNTVIPPFGGYDPNAGARFGFSRLGPNGGGFSLGLQMGKGNSRSNVSTTPSIVVQNGYGGSVVNGAFVPFVTGVTPVVGNGNNILMPRDNAVTRAINSGQLDLTKPLYDEEITHPARIYSEPNSTAQSGDFSVEAIKAARKASIVQKQQKLEELIKRSETYRDEGKLREARIAIRKAIKSCEDDRLKKQLRKKLSELSDR